MKKLLLIGCACLLGGMLISCSKNKNHSEFTKVTDYLYEVTYDSYEENFEQTREYLFHYKPQLGGCSSAQVGNIYGRNYDWTYDQAPEFLVHVPAKEGRHASIGVATTTTINCDDVDSGKELNYYKMLPYFTLDGINDAGLAININVVNFGEKGIFEMKTETTDDDIFPLIVPRLVLDNCGSLEEAVKLISEMDIFSIGTQEEVHYMLSGPKSASDKTRNSIVIEFIPDENHHYQLSIIDAEKGQFVDNKIIMTNFHLTGFDGSVESLTAHPMGYERYLILSESYELGKTVNGMQELMKKVYYTRAYDPYSDMFWYSELAGGNLTMKNTGAKKLNGNPDNAGAYKDVVVKHLSEFENYTRDTESKRWHTVHTSVFDLDKKELYVLPQEAGFAYKFSL